MKSLKKIWQDYVERREEKARAKEGYEKICDAIIARDAARVKGLLEEGVSPGRKFKTHQRNPMELSVVAGTAEIVELMLEHGGSPNWDHYDHMLEIGYSRTTLLELAIGYGKEDTALVLAKHPETNILDAGESKIGDKHRVYDKPLKHARNKGMDSLASVLAAREAEMLRAEARKLEQKNPTP